MKWLQAIVKASFRRIQASNRELYPTVLSGCLGCTSRALLKTGFHALGTAASWNDIPTQPLLSLLLCELGEVCQRELGKLSIKRQDEQLTQWQC
ncbi:unnamed protein product [Protopolystoma xenopodis]|uniref:Uncharacterized protein n=1 Tax=Protopolystoma xenopodis TaxID=117903 RepID=A0A3S5CDB2_9PLAT|nr:unnamed protein product [Protopolystoma xenopodis]